MIGGLMRRMSLYAASSDPRMAAANTLALVLGGNAPFFPLYLYFVVGRAFWPSLYGLWSMPPFLLVPLLGRRHTLAARLMLAGTAIANTLVYVGLFGSPAGVQLFLFPCITLGLLFHHRERYLAWALGGVPLLLYLAIQHWGVAGLYPLGPHRSAGVYALAAASLCTLTWFMMVTFGTMAHALERPAA